MERSEVVMERIRRIWPSDIPLPEVRFGIPVEPIDWAATFDDELYARAKAALAVVRQGFDGGESRLTAQIRRANGNSLRANR
jgi:hypothetical protein